MKSNEEKLRVLADLVGEDLVRKAFDDLVKDRIKEIDENNPELDAVNLLAKIGNHFLDMDLVNDENLLEYILMQIVNYYREESLMSKKISKYMIVRNERMRIRDAIPLILKTIHNA